MDRYISTFGWLTDQTLSIPIWNTSIRYQISQVLLNIAKKEGLSLPQDISNRIAEQSERNLRKAILTLEAMKVKQ